MFFQGKYLIKYLKSRLFWNLSLDFDLYELIWIGPGKILSFRDLFASYSMYGRHIAARYYLFPWTMVYIALP